MNLPNKRMLIVSAMPMSRGPAIRNTSAITTVGFLPSLSANGPPKSDPMADPSNATETIV